MSERLFGKVVLITGGTSGIGRASVELFVAEGARVVFTGRNSERGASIARTLGVNAHFFAADVTSESGVKAAIDEIVRRFGTIDVLFNNAGGGTEGDAETVTPSNLERATNLLLGSVLFGIKHSVPIMKANGGGVIISNASVAAHRGHMGGYLYSIAKASVVHASRMAAIQLGAHNIRVNSISPGAIATPIFLGGSDVADGLEAAKVEAKMTKLTANLAKATPLRASGVPRDIAYGALYLASDDARFVTGHDLVIDGGMSAGGRTNYEDP